MSLSNGGWTLQQDPAQIPDATGTYVYWLVLGTGRETYAKDNSAAVRMFYVDWVLRTAFVDSLLGYSTIGNAYSILREPPDDHPDLPNFYCTECSVDPHLSGPTASGGVEHYKLAIVTATYRPLDYDVVSDGNIDSEIDRYVTRLYDSSSEFLSTGNPGYKFVTSPSKVLNYAPGRVTGSTEFQIIWHEVPSKTDDPYDPPTAQIETSLRGMVNSTTFDGRKPGEVLYLFAKNKFLTPRLSGDNPHWDITYNFQLRNNGSPVAGDTVNQVAGHNYIFRSDLGTYDLVTAGTNAGAANGTQIFAATDLNQLFTITSTS